jgi:hypothetical protein
MKERWGVGKTECVQQAFSERISTQSERQTARQGRRSGIDILCVAVAGNVYGVSVGCVNIQRVPCLHSHYNHSTATCTF